MATPAWRWDQGRLSYFAFDNLKSIASCLLGLDGVELGGVGGDPLRGPLERSTGLSFPPPHYTVWRNFGRVFAAAFLAVSLDHRLVITEACRELSKGAEEAWDADQYLCFLIPRFYFPFPGFTDYDPDATQVFPFCSILRYLLALVKTGREPGITLDSVFSVIIGNNCRGTESLDKYLALDATGYKPGGAERRQVRELLIFVSQLSYLEWYGDTLYLDIQQDELETIESLEVIATPFVKVRQKNRALEILSLGLVQGPLFIPTAPPSKEAATDRIFTEGKRIRVTHLRVERSSRLRREFLSSLRRPILCDMCLCDTKKLYPWVESLLEVHHLLPLRSPITVTKEGTSFSNLLPLCPTCHKGAHVYYRIWLKEAGLEDFPSPEEARNVYAAAKGKFRQGEG